MSRLPIWRVSSDYALNISSYCQLDGFEPPIIFPVVFSQKRLERTLPEARVLRSTPAFSIGGVIPHIELWGRVLAKGNCPAGLICFEENFESLFDFAEKEFILAHEYSHIIKNHCPLMYVGGLASSIVKRYVAEVEDKMAKMTISLIWKYIETVTAATFKRQFELDADAHALELTGDRDTALRTIEKIGTTFAGNLSMPSHYLVRGKSVISILSYQERLDALKTT